jgi:hypothetical protein
LTDVSDIGIGFLAGAFCAAELRCCADAADGEREAKGRIDM